MQHPTIPTPRFAAAGCLAAGLALAFATQTLLAEDLDEKGKETAAAFPTSKPGTRAPTMIPCPDCRASGRETCPECDGAGKHMKACPRCSGTAQRPCPVCNDPADEDETPAGAVTCTACSGRGTLGSSVRRQCSKCQGQGTYRCLTCFGDGLLRCRPEVLDHHCRRCRRVGKIECRTCGGRRRISKKEATERDRAGRKAADGPSAGAEDDEGAGSFSGPRTEESSRPAEERFTALVDLLEKTEARLREDPRRQLLDSHAAASELERRLKASAHPEMKELADEAAAVRRRAGALHSRWGSMLEVRDVFERTVEKCDMVWQRKSTLSPKDPLERHQSWEEDMRLALRIAERVARRLEDLGLPSLDEEIETMRGRTVEIREKSREITRAALARAREAEEGRDGRAGRTESANGPQEPSTSPRSRETSATQNDGNAGEDASAEAIPPLQEAAPAAGPNADPAARAARGSGPRNPGPTFSDRPEKKASPAGTRHDEAAAASPGFLAGVLWGAGACAFGALVFRFLLGGTGR